ncbi:hypothetical protein [Pigmentiphaga aceris]|uniref:hypothetical protein n=1 Tax=Pigmentiphaga aceris TaxID=1940612 RepID=UPI0016520B0E|nr:hypothetical protein [Pigmentiphaga aceris]
MTRMTLDFDPARVVAPTGHIIGGRLVNVGEGGMRTVQATRMPIYEPSLFCGMPT